MKVKSHELVVTLCYVLLLQLAIPPVAAQPPVPVKLNIVVLEGEGAINNMRQRTAREPV